MMSTSFTNNDLSFKSHDPLKSRDLAMVTPLVNVKIYLKDSRTQYLMSKLSNHPSLTLSLLFFQSHVML